MNAHHTHPDGEGDPRPSLLIADDDDLVRSVLNAHLAGDFQVIGLAKTVTEAIELAAEHRPDAALIDVEMPEGGARKAVPQIVARSPQTCIVILSGDETRDLVLELLNAGAMAYLRKGVPGAEISKTLRDALKAKADPLRP